MSVMPIEGLYPSRLQSQRHNPLFARERRRKRLIGLLALGFGLFAFVGLRIPPSPVQASTPAVQGPAEVTAPAVHVIAQAASTAPKRKVRIIPLYAEPADATMAAPKKA
jgi:hypothetical protein